ncbi:hybrid sensor histidine kinase/response regulator [Pseudomonas saliphila]|uniref:hybrid sensor histidine kinase/response regulator n=1 Tax=Pseudomonas saliphila TaxID=2586906 RepID=UPI0012386397|nr:hybrid sensor histidine kinase/response regulator [Pseudomonas saliphila]
MSERQLLVVDDNAATRYAIRRRLEAHGYRVIEAGNGTDGLAVIDSQPIDALILDINLPDMSGFDIARRLRADPRTAVLPVIHVSAASIETGDIINGLESGADAYLVHPIDPDVLIATLGTLLRVRDTERALKEREEHFREIFENISAPIAVVDSSLKVHNKNQAFSRLITKCPGEDMSKCMGDSQDELLEVIRARIKAGERWTGTATMRGAFSERITQWQIAPYRAPDLALVFIEDVTERLQKERSQEQQLATVSHQLQHEVKERERTEAQLLQAGKMDSLGKLTGGIAHDFNNLLTSVIMSLELINERVAAGRYNEIKRFADTALQSAKSGAGLTHRLLAFARQQPLEARSVDLNALIRSLDDFIRRSIGESITLTLQLSPDAVIAYADSSQLESALINLVVNARDAMPEGGQIWIGTELVTIERDPELADGQYVALSVRDNGTGIEPELLEKVFDPFFTTKSIGKGTGLGLSMLYGFSRQSGGVTRVCSAVGEFTEVMLLLPVGEKMDEAPTADEATAHAAASGHILVVEDIVAVSAAITERLADAGYQCTQTDNVESALALLQGDGPIDLLLTDIGLPRMNGRELAAEARRLRPTLPVLFMTGYAESAKDRKNFNEPGFDILLKPFNIDELLGKLLRLMANPG